MIDTPSRSAPSALVAASAAKARALAKEAMHATGTQSTFRSVAMAWPAITEVTERLAYYLSDQLRLPGAEPLLHTCFRRFHEQMGDWQHSGLTTQAIRHGVAAMLCTVRGLSGVQAWRGEFRWDPSLGVSFTEFMQGQTIRIEAEAGATMLHPDVILRVVGHYTLTPIALQSLGRDLRKLIREYEAACLR